MKKILVSLLLFGAVCLSGCGNKAVDYTENMKEQLQEDGRISPYNTPNAHKTAQSEDPLAIENSNNMASSDTASAADSGEMTIIDTATQEIPLELKEYSCKSRTEAGDDDTVYIDYCGLVYNPNMTMLATQPEVKLTIKSAKGDILASGSAIGVAVKPGDTVTLCGTVPMNKRDKASDMEVHFDIAWKEITVQNMETTLGTTDFTINGITERGDNSGLITAEITNNSNILANSVNVSIILRNNGKIVYMDSTIVQELNPGNTKEVQFACYGGWPDHTAVEISAQPW